MKNKAFIGKANYCRSLIKMQVTTYLVPISSTIFSLYFISLQLCLVFKDTSSLISDNYDRLVAKFRSLLLRATPERPLGKFILIGERRRVLVQTHRKITIKVILYSDRRREANLCQELTEYFLFSFVPRLTGSTF